MKFCLDTALSRREHWLGVSDDPFHDVLEIFFVEGDGLTRACAACEREPLGSQGFGERNRIFLRSVVKLWVLGQVLGEFVGRSEGARNGVIADEVGDVSVILEHASGGKRDAVCVSRAALGEKEVAEVDEILSGFAATSDESVVSGGLVGLEVGRRDSSDVAAVCGVDDVCGADSGAVARIRAVRLSLRIVADVSCLNNDEVLSVGDEGGRAVEVEGAADLAVVKGEGAEVLGHQHGWVALGTVGAKGASGHDEAMTHSGFCCAVVVELRNKLRKAEVTSH